MDHCMHNNASVLHVTLLFLIIFVFVWLIVPLIAFARLTESRTFVLLECHSFTPGPS